MGDLTITNLKVGENESGLVHWCEATLSDGKKAKDVRVEFIDMPLVDDQGKLRMDAVGSMLQAAYLAPEFVNPPPEENGEDIEEPIEDEPMEIDEEYLARRRERLNALKSEAAKLGKTITVKDALTTSAEVAP